jgi:hypothetical protein
MNLKYEVVFEDNSLFGLAGARKITAELKFPFVPNSLDDIPPKIELVR